MNIKDEVKKIIESLIPERAKVNPEDYSVFTYYVSWSKETKDPKEPIKLFKPIAIEILDETITMFNSLLIDEKIKKIEEIKSHLTSKFQEFTPDFTQPTDSEYPKIVWKI